MEYNLDEATVCVVGLGYVGLPLAEAFARAMRVIGFDVDSNKICAIGRVNSNRNLVLTGSPAELHRADYIIIAVPTPLTEAKEPDLTYVKSAAKLVGQNMKKGSVVVLESTVYPGVTEEIVKPILEEESGLKCGQDFKIGYSPERINPGDAEHAVDRVTKVVAGMDGDTTELLAQLYGRITPSVFKAKDIKTAEATKVVENVQRDLNIALMNELALIFDKLDISTRDVLEAAATKWNFHRYSPGLVGGHCIPVVPHYLVYKARELGYNPQIILAGRAVNDYMPRHVARMTAEALTSVGKVAKGSRVLVMGLTYKEDVDDVRESPVKEVIKWLREYGVEVWGYDPLLADVEGEFGVKAVRSLREARQIDAIIIAVVHKAFTRTTLDELRAITNANPVLIDIRGFYPRAGAEEKGFYYKSL